jgi:hypothetical protein
LLRDNDEERDQDGEEQSGERGGKREVDKVVGAERDFGLSVCRDRDGERERERE